MYYLSLIYFVSQPLHVSGMFIAHHQEVFTVYVQQLVRVVCLGDWQLPLHTPHPASEDGTDRGFQNVGKPKYDAGEIPKRTYTIFRTR
jgi:hypothetical protein